ncbi:MAG: hypothetical protein LBV45_10275 [Xanthomonadaceae bacterium]|jgi:hypothetical protein|nr:hypothetical protein [Xanthomonadaceae bacterium]
MNWSSIDLNSRSIPERLDIAIRMATSSTRSRIETLTRGHCNYQTEKVRSTYSYTVTYDGEIIFPPAHKKAALQ